MRRILLGAIAAALLAPLVAVLPAQADPELPPGHVDVIAFGDQNSEAAHAFTGEFTSVVDGALGEKARVANPTNPPSPKGGELRFRMKVDPVAQNYFTLKFWGGDSSGYKSVAYINGEQIGYRRSGDYEAINTGHGRPLPNRFYYSTIMLPLQHTQGQHLVEMTVRTYDGAFAAPVTQNSRGYYRAYTHTAAYLDVSGEKQGSFTPDTTPAAGPAEAEQQAMIDRYRQSQIGLFNQHSAYLDAAQDRKLSIVRYQDDLRFYAMALLQPWVPANTPELKKAALMRLFKAVDNHVKDYYGNTGLLLRGGHQGDWGGYYGALGEALYIVENLIKDDAILGAQAWDAFLDQPFVTNTQDGPASLKGVDWEGGELSRREAYERVLKANFDFARSRLSYIYNQVMYTYEGAWEAHEGLRVIGSTFYEGKERSHRIAGEALGWEPFLGEEVLVGPGGEELDVYHSLFWHDQTARFTDDYVQTISKGLAKSKLDADGRVVRRLPYGKHYTGITKAGLTRENTFVANYGESTNYLPEWFYRTWGHAGDEQLNDEILKLALKNLHARGFTRYTDVDDNGKRVMRAEMVVDERNTGFPGWPAYGLRVSEGRIMEYVSLEKHMADHPERYAGDEWKPYWDYAAEAVGFAQQQRADNQFFNAFGSVEGKRKYDLWLAESYAYITKGRAGYDRFGKVAAGKVMPHTDFAFYTPEQLQALGVNPADYERFAFADVDNMFVSVRDGDTRIFGSLFERQRGVAGNGRLHVLTGTHHAIVQLATDGEFSYQDYYLRMNNIDVDFMEDQQTGDGTLPQALAGEVAPAAHQPGVGTVRREGFEVDHPYAGYRDFLTARYGSYLFAFNTTRQEYGNKRDFTLQVPGDAFDLVSGKPVARGAVTVPPETAMVLRLDSAVEQQVKPHKVDFVQALRGPAEQVVLTWKPASGAESYTIERDGQVVAKDVRGTSFTDRHPKAASYTVTAVNRHGSGWPSQAAKVADDPPGEGPWRADKVGEVSGTVKIDNFRVAVSGGNGKGLGDGDEHRLSERPGITDSLHLVNQVLTGPGSITAKIDEHSGPLSGVMLRDQLATATRYISFGADADGKLVLRNRTRDSFHDWQDERRSPLNARIPAYTAAQYPWVRLVRDVDGQMVRAWASKDGRAWEFVAEMFTPFPEGVHAGVAAATAATFSHVHVERDREDTLYARVERDRDQVRLHWSKPDQAVRFNVYRTIDPKVATTRGVEGWSKILSDMLTFSHADSEPLRYGTRYYKVTAIGADGVERNASRMLVATARPLAEVLAEAERLVPADYTKGSFYLLSTTVAEVKEAMKQEGFDEEALINRIYAAIAELMPATTLLKKVPIQPSMVEASTVIWPGTGTKAENGWRAVDGDITTYTDTTTATGWIDVRLPNAVALDGLRFYPRATHTTRMNGVVFQGSADGGVTWTALHTVSGVSEARWYEVKLARTAAYPRLRIAFPTGGNTNVAEAEFLTTINDSTLLAVLIGEASAIDRSRYTDDSVASMAAALAAAEQVLANGQATQQEIDTAADRLRTAIENLVPRAA
ncbi:hypothetical protein ACTMTI_46135 [Nonomuraea sp. H19]|uniref:hypothetical protein n=1 Tax=Nonomuraea sp. H19 TaxID=3452206 RepID=UPI003F8CB838